MVIDVGGEGFTATGLMVTDRNWLEVCAVHMAVGLVCAWVDGGMRGGRDAGTGVAAVAAAGDLHANNPTPPTPPRQVYRYTSWGGQGELPVFQQGQQFVPAAVDLKQVGGVRGGRAGSRCWGVVVIRLVCRPAPRCCDGLECILCGCRAPRSLRPGSQSAT